MSARTLERVFEYVGWYSGMFGKSPTIAEVAADIGRCYDTARMHLATLVARGRLQRTANHERGWTLPNGPAPEPTLSEQNREGCREVAALYAALGSAPIGKIGDGRKVAA